MRKIRPLLLQWELHIQKEYRKRKQQEEKQKVLPNIFWLSIIPMEESTELSVIHRQDFWKKFMVNLFRSEHALLLHCEWGTGV